MRFEIFSSKHGDLWDAFIEDSINGTFLHKRNYMDYHSDRFVDHSLLVFDEKNNLIALLPANHRDSKLVSHEGLTYGGLIVNKDMKTHHTKEVFEALLSYLRDNNISQFYYKSIPSIYHKIPCDADIYSLFCLDAALVRRDIYSVIDYTAKLSPNLGSQRLRAIKKAQKSNLDILEVSTPSRFFQLLSHVLQARHGIKPVHNEIELSLLKERFPKNIRIFECCNRDEVYAGVVVFDTKHTAHAQYIACSDSGMECGALDLLFVHLLELFKNTHKYFSFGISNEQNGRYLNKGLIMQKEGFGARGIIHDHYMISF